ncbi:putative acyl-CoA oxidase [Mollisia scopiformis]|uniref:Putative acyl-CoA oxidase n=1 Tax=Mollisia scopiformis TaxID=149040 RepID=A0A194WYJ9_MOLSC|nr:putative acyl-CoA oxidase [Mollisia scopiformis]KUJ13020.1 putative acyl-CoA oxidase [Mollisia scopiformis]
MNESQKRDIQTGDYPTKHLLQHHLFKPNSPYLAEDERVAISYQRAREIGRAYEFTAHDIHKLTPKFWKLHADPINTRDNAAFTLLTIQYNLAAGTIAPYAAKLPHLQTLLKSILNFDVSAQYLLTEVGHGLDAPNLETTATLLTDGGFELHTPHDGAVKIMPPTSPRGIPCVGVVMARLLVNGQDRGIRPFIVNINNGKHMYKGITSRNLPTRTGSKPLHHSLTTFTHLNLPPTSLLGALSTPEPHFQATIWRVGVGSLALSLTYIPILKVSLYIVSQYSLRRLIQQNRLPIITFSTQHRPLLFALSRITVWESYAGAALRLYLDANLSDKVRAGIAAAFKACLTRGVQGSLYWLAERCGAQGLFVHNQIVELQLAARGVSIAEGDVLALCIRLATELLIGRYALPAPTNPSCFLALHEAGLFQEARSLMSTMSSHRSPEFNQLILPLCQPLVESIGERMAYEAAVADNIDKDILDLYEVSAMMRDLSWFTENLGMTREEVKRRESETYGKVLGKFGACLRGLGVEEYCTAPIMTEQGSKAFIDGLKVFGSEERDEGTVKAKL